MRILTVGNMYPPHSQGGYELVWQAAVSHLRAGGHAVRILTTDHREPDVVIGEDFDVHRELGWYWREHDFPRLRPIERLRLERRNARILDRHLSGFRPHVVCWWAMGGMSLSLIERVRREGVPAACAICDDWLLYGPKVDGWIRAFQTRPQLGRVLDRLTGIPTAVSSDALGPSLFLSNTVRERARPTGFDLADAAVCYLGVSAMFQPRERPPWGWRLAYVGRLDPRKGVDLAILALTHLPEDATLRIDGRGDASYLEELRLLAERESVSERVRFSRVPRSELPAVYAEADAIVFPVRWEEPWGLVPLEAMAVGAPVVATGRGGSGEYLADGENCVIFEPDGGAVALAAAVRRLGQNTGLRERLREAGLQTAARFREVDFNRAVEGLLERATIRATT